MITEADEGADDLVLTHDGLQFLQRLLFGEGRGKLQRCAGADVLRDDLIHELIQGAATEGREHFVCLRAGGTNVPAGKGCVTGHG